MTDTELIDGIAKYGISLWPDRESRTVSDSPIKEWNTFARDPRIGGYPVQIRRATLRAALVDTITKLET